MSQLSALLQLAVALDQRRIGAIKEVRCEYIPEVQELHLQLQASQPEDDCALELWNLDYKKGVFEAEYGIKLLATLESTALPVS